jgi:hypothetical protein
MNWKGCRRSGSNLILRYYLGIRLEGQRRITKNLSKSSRSPERDLNPRPPKYEAGVLSISPRRSVHGT